MLTVQATLPLWAVLLGAASIVTSAAFLLLRINYRFKATEFAYEMKCTIDLFEQMAPDDQNFGSWLDGPNPLLLGRTPCNLMNTCKFSELEQLIMKEFSN